MSEEFIVELPDLGIKLNTFDPQVDPIISNWLHRDKIWEPMMTKMLLKDLERFRYFIDVGANIGYYTVLALSRGARVAAFEPDPRNFEMLQKNVELNFCAWPKRENANYVEYNKEWELKSQLFNNAISNSEYELILTCDEANSGDIRTVREDDSDYRIILRTRTKTLTGSLIPYFSSHPSILKLDIQGLEYQALQGLDFRPSIIYTEIEQPLLELNTSSLNQIMSWFEDNEYFEYVIIDEVNKDYKKFFTAYEAQSFLEKNRDTYPGHFNVRIS